MSKPASHGRTSALALRVPPLPIVFFVAAAPIALSTCSSQPKTHATAPSPSGAVAPPTVASTETAFQVPPKPQATGPEPIVQIGPALPGRSIALHPGGKVFAVPSGPDVLLFDVESAAQRAQLHGVGEKRALAFSPDGTTLLAGGMNQAIEGWDLGTGERRFLGKEQFGVFKLLALPGRGYLIGSRSTVAWRPSLESPSRVIAGGVYSYAIHPTDPVLYYAGYDLVATNLEADRPLWKVSSTGSSTRPLAMRKDGKVVAWSPDGKRIVLYDTSTGAPVSKMSDLPGASYVQFSPDGSRLAVSDGQTTHLLDPQTRRRVAQFEKQSIEVLGFSPDSSIIATVNDHGVTVSNGRNGSAVSFLPTRRRVLAAQWTPDSKFVVGGLSEGRMAVWDVRGDRRFSPERDIPRLSKVAWAPDGRQVLILGWKRPAIVDATTATLTELIDLPERHESIETAAWSSDGRTLALGTHVSLYLQDRTTRELRKVFHESHFGIARRPYFSPDGRWLLMAGTQDGAPVLFSARTAAAVKKLPIGKGSTNAGAWSSDGKRWAAGGADLVQVVEVDHDRIVFTADAPSPVVDMAWLDRERLASLHQGGALLVWKVGETEPVQRLALPEKTGHRVAASEDGQWLAATSYDGGVHIWDAHGFQLVSSTAGEGRGASDLAWVPCSNVLSALRGELTFFEPGGKVMSMHLLEPKRTSRPDVLVTRIDGAYAGSAGGMEALRLRDRGPWLTAPLRTAEDLPDLHAQDIGARWLGQCGSKRR